jgi:cardiolipin synthase
MDIPAWLIFVVVLLVHVAGLVCALHAIMTARTPQGSIAWAVALVGFPYLALPFYLVFGRSGFQGYVEAMRSARIEGRTKLEELLEASAAHAAELEPGRRVDLTVLEKLAPLPWLRGNHVRLLIDGEQAFDAMLQAVRSAQHYVLVQFFIIHADEIGMRLKTLLLEKLRQGVRVHLLYDEVGCHALPLSWTKDLEAAGAQVTGFRATRGWKNRFQLNFRNHRKIILVDGREAFIGGMNVGDEYLGRGPFGHWRDTQIGIRGPAVQSVQLSFIMNWYWAVRTLPQLEWRPVPEPGGEVGALVLPTGPADAINGCEMMFLEAIHAARRRLWITSPYFVPSPAVFEALRGAALRGVDVRVLLPNRPDHILVFLAAFPCVTYARSAGVRVYRYAKGFMHQKVVLIDDDLAAVGTANLDERSLRLNFEMTLWCANRGFASDVEAMLERDFAASKLIERDELDGKTYFFRIATQLARLMDPVL